MSGKSSVPQTPCDANIQADAYQRSERLMATLAVAAAESKLAGELACVAQAESELRATRHEYRALERTSRETQIWLADLRRGTEARGGGHSGDGRLPMQRSRQGGGEKQILHEDQARAAPQFAGQIAALQQKVADAEARLHAEARNAAALEQSLACEQAAGAQARERLAEAGAKVLALEVKADHLERDIERREQRAAALLSSTSWRLSAPWRAYRRMVSRLRRLLHGKKMNPLFDREWYLQQYPDVKESEIDPYDHYLRHGAAEGRDPNPLFDTVWYLQQTPDVRERGANPLIHFYLHGAAEGRDPHPLFSKSWFFQQYPLLQKEGTNALVHYLRLIKQE